jgi:glyoxylase-like metal-dependent hydrolase (beta-lactamase superfamily II)
VSVLPARARRPWPVPQQVAPGVYLVTLGKGAAASNSYLVRSGPTWTLIDTGWASNAAAIRTAAEAVFGPGARPTAVLLTHIHPDHSGSAGDLARSWEVPVYVHADEVPAAAGKYLPQYAMPLDQWVIAPPWAYCRPGPARGSKRRAASPTSCVDWTRSWACRGWRTGSASRRPGHTPGHVAYLRRRDGVLLAGDAALTVDLNSVDGLLFGRQRVAGPPWYMTWDWPAAKRSVQVLAELEPRVLLPGHGRPLTAGTATMLHAPWPRVARAPTGAEVCACGACCLATAAPTGTGRLQGCTPGCSGWASR